MSKSAYIRAIAQQLFRLISKVRNFAFSYILLSMKCNRIEILSQRRNKQSEEENRVCKSDFKLQAFRQKMREKKRNKKNKTKTKKKAISQSHDKQKNILLYFYCFNRIKSRGGDGISF